MGYISRVVKIGNWNDFVLGRDIGKALKDDTVYGVTELMGVITLTPIGTSARISAFKDMYPGRKIDSRKIGQVALDGTTYITVEEYKAQGRIHRDDLDELPEG